MYGHLDGSITHPVTAAASLTTATTITLGITTAAASQTTQTSPTPNPVLQWDKDESLALDLLTQHIPDSTVIHTSGLGTAAAMWVEILCEFTTKSVFAQTELCTKFMASKCLEKGNVHTWLEKLWTRKEELAKVRVNIKDKDFHSVIIFSLPGYLSEFTATLLTNTQLYSTNKTVDPDIFISLINEEYHHCAALHNKPAQASQSRGGWNLDEALAVSSSPPFHPNCSSQHHNGSNHGGHPQCPNSNKHVYWNCDSPNHLCSNCPEPKKTTTHLANVALDNLGDDGNIALGVIDTSDDDNDEYSMMPDLVTVSSHSDGGIDDQLCDRDDSNGEAFSEVEDDAESPWGTGWDSEELSGLNNKNTMEVLASLNFLFRDPKTGTGLFCSDIIVTTLSSYYGQIQGVVDVWDINHSMYFCDEGPIGPIVLLLASISPFTISKLVW